jgi:hypothetical protein
MTTKKAASVPVMCALFALLSASGCLSMMGMGPRRLQYRERESGAFTTVMYMAREQKVKMPADYLERAIGKPDWVVEYARLPQFMPHPGMRESMEKEIENSLKETGTTRPASDAKNYVLWCYEERKRFGWMGLFPATLAFFLVDPDGKIIAYGEIFTNESVEKAQKHFKTAGPPK